MIITKIKTLRLKKYPLLLWVVLETDEGITGLGETWPNPATLQAVICQNFATFLLGQDPLRIEWIWNNIFRMVNSHGWAGAELRALSAVDIALWDILGKYTGQPVYQLLGGSVRDKIKVYNTVSGADLEIWNSNPGKLAKDLLEDKIDVIKIAPFDRYSVPPYLGYFLPQEDLESGLDEIRQVKQAVGEKLQIAIEGHGRYHMPVAKQIACALEPYNILWMEDIILNENVGALAELKNATKINLAVSERLFTRFQLREVLERRAADFIITDPCWTGGISEAKKIATMVESYEIPFAPHNGLSPVQHVVSAHLCANIPNLWLMEFMRSMYKGFFKDVLTYVPEIKGGYCELPQGPGLGTALKPEVWEREDALIEVIDIKSVTPSTPTTGSTLSAYGDSFN